MRTWVITLLLFAASAVILGVGIGGDRFYPPDNTRMDRAPCTVYHVDATSGNNDSSGCGGEAWQTVSKVNAESFDPGDQILFKRGEIWREQLVVPGGGSSGLPVTFGAYGAGADPIISGADLASGWVLHAGSVWKVDPHADPENQVFFDGTRGTEEAVLGNVDAANEWHWAANVLYVYSAGGDPDTEYTSPGIEASTRGTCVNIDGDDKDYVSLDNLTVAGAKYYGIFIDNGPDYLTIQNSTIRDQWLAGIQLYDSDHTDDATNLTIDGNTVRDNKEHGISLLDDFDIATITNNTIHDNASNDTSPVLSGAYIKDSGVTLAGDVLIDSNTAYDNGGSVNGNGIYVDTLKGDGTVTVSRNESYDNLVHGIVIEDTDAAKVHYNLAHGNGQYGVNIWRNNSSVQVYNNTTYGNNVGIYLDDVAESCNSNLIRNNLIAGNSWYELYADDDCANADGGSRNVYQYNSLDAEASNFIYWDDSNHSTYDSWETAYGGTTSSVEADPLFTDPVTDDYTLQSGSPAINAGTDVGLTTDLLGNPIVLLPDMGCYEVQ